MDFIEDDERAEAYRVLADIFFEPPAAEALEAMKEDFQLESKEGEEEILGDFNLLFAYQGGAMPPLESLHSSTGGAAAAKVAAFYTDAGLTIDEEFQPIPDHISLEFLFMSYLIETRRPELQEKFLEEHIMNWVPHYCEGIKREAKTVFYREIAGITVDFLSNEYEGLE